MIEKKIFFKTLDDVKKFVSVVSTKTYDIELLSGKYVVNPISVMGVFSLALTSPITMIANTDNDDSLLKEIEAFSEAVVSVK